MDTAVGNKNHYCPQLYFSCSLPTCNSKKQAFPPLFSPNDVVLLSKTKATVVGGGGERGGGGRGGSVQIADCFVSKMEVIHSGVMLMIHYSVSTILALNYCRCTLG